MPTTSLPSLVHTAAHPPKKSPTFAKYLNATEPTPMHIYFRLLRFASPLGRFVVPYFVFSLLSTLFSLVNFTLIIPLLDILFGNVAKETATPTVAPDFSLSVAYFKDLFYHFFGTLIATHGERQALLFVCGIVVASVFLTNLFRYLARRIIEYLRAHSIRNIRAALFNATSRLHIGYFSDRRKGDMLSRMTTDAYEVEVSLTSSLPAFFQDPFTLIAYFLILFNLSAELTLFTILIIPLSGGLISFIVKRLRREAISLQQSLSVLISMLDETLGGLRVVKAFNGLTYVQQKFAEENDAYARKSRRLAYRREIASPLSELMGVGVVAGILFYGGNLVFQEQSELTASEFVGYIIIFSQVLRPAKAISGAISNIQRGIVAGQRILETIDAPPAITSPAQAVPLERFSKGITFRNVGFAYDTEPVLHGVSFTLEKGQTVALVGPSGGGKSTIADLIPRFYDVAEGEILLDDHDLRAYDLEALRRLMGVVTQESFLFNDTLFNNIAFGQPRASLEQVIQAAKVANAHDFIMETPQGYQTVVGDRGVKLSGGQRQRISIARAIFKNPPILILDEATSALDNESEKLVQDALTKLMQSRTSLVIAHRLSTVQHADKILVIDQGRIAEQGTHEELLQNPEGLYTKLQAMQTSPRF